MKTLLKVLLGGTALFMSVAIVEQWEFFSSAWFGRVAPPTRLTDEQRRSAADTVREFLVLMTHLEASGGDARFADRLPAARAVADELQAELDYLGANQRVQQLSLQRLEVTSVEPSARGWVEVRTRELWLVHTLWAVDRRPAQPSRPSVLHLKYLLSPVGTRWRVEAWELDEPGGVAETP